MPVRTILIASAAFVVALPAFAQQTPEPRAQTPALAAPPEPEGPAPSRDDVYVTAARPLPVPSVEGATTFEARQRHRDEARCVLNAQAAVDPTEFDSSVPEDMCRPR